MSGVKQLITAYVINSNYDRYTYALINCLMSFIHGYFGHGIKMQFRFFNVLHCCATLNILFEKRRLRLVIYRVLHKNIGLDTNISDNHLLSIMALCISRMSLKRIPKWPFNGDTEPQSDLPLRL